MSTVSDHEPLVVPVQVMPEAEGLPLPGYQSPGAAGMDLLAAVRDPVVLQPGGRALITTGLRLQLPAGYEAQIRPRSGLAIRHGVTLLNTPGTVDADYRGTVQVVLVNLGEEPFTVERGDRIAQMVLAPVQAAQLVAVPEVDNTERGGGGFGSTGRQ